MLDPDEETRLLPLAFAGFATALTVYITGDNEHLITLAFAPIVIFWAIGERACEGFLYPLSVVVCYGASVLTMPRHSFALLCPNCIYYKEGNGVRPIKCRVALRYFLGGLFRQLDCCQTAMI